MIASAKHLAADEARFLIQPRDNAAVVQIGKRVYLVKFTMGDSGELCWNFHTEKSGVYTVMLRGREPITCTCPDRLFRRRECKHSRCVRELYHAPVVLPGY